MRGAMSEMQPALRIAFAWLCIGAALCIVIAAGLPLPGASPKLAYRVGVGMPAPSFTLRNLAGEPVSLDSTEGKLTILNFWSSSCAPCRREMPDLQRLYDDHRASLRILAINLGEEAAVLQSWRDELGLGFDLLLDPLLSVARQYQIRGLPTSFLLDKRQVIQAVFFGPLGYRETRAHLQRLALRT